MALFEGTINQIENTQHKINNIEKYDSDGKQKQYSDNDYPNVNAVTKYVKEEIEEKLNKKAEELQTNIDKKADTSTLETEISTLNTNKLNKSDIDTELNTGSENPVQNKAIATVLESFSDVIQSKADKEELSTKVTQEVLNQTVGMQQAIDNKVDKSTVLTGAYNVIINNLDSSTDDPGLFYKGSESAHHLLFCVNNLPAGTYYFSYMINYHSNITINDDYKDDPSLEDWDPTCMFNISADPADPDTNGLADISIGTSDAGCKLVGTKITLSNNGSITIILTGENRKVENNYVANGTIKVECSNINIIKL